MCSAAQAEWVTANPAGAGDAESAGRVEGTSPGPPRRCPCGCPRAGVATRGRGGPRAAPHLQAPQPCQARHREQQGPLRAPVPGGGGGEAVPCTSRLRECRTRGPFGARLGQRASAGLAGVRRAFPAPYPGTPGRAPAHLAVVLVKLLQTECWLCRCANGGNSAATSHLWRKGGSRQVAARGDWRLRREKVGQFPPPRASCVHCAVTPPATGGRYQPPQRLHPPVNAGRGFMVHNSSIEGFWSHTAGTPSRQPQTIQDCPPTVTNYRLKHSPEMYGPPPTHRVAGR